MNNEPFFLTTILFSKQVNFQVLDYNDNAPVFPVNCCNLSVSEKFPVGEVIYTFLATDADGPMNNQISYILLDYGGTDTGEGCS